MVCGTLPKFFADVAAVLHPQKNMISDDCPLNFTIIDQYGRTLSDDGTNQIPNASVVIFNDTKIFYLPTDLTYLIEIDAYDSGSFNLSRICPVEPDISVTKFENVAITPNTKASVEIEPNVTSYTMSIDYDGDGEIDEDRSPDINETIEVNQPPNASFTYLPEDPRAYANVTFNASGSFDPDGSITTYEWDFGDDQNGEGIEVAHSYSLPRNYTVFLRVTD